MQKEIKKSNKSYFNIECPICFDEDGDMIILSCLHRFHEICLEGHTNLDCPKCRQHVINWSPSLKEKIIKNSKEFTLELNEADRRNIIQNENEFLSTMSMFLQPPPQLEVASALNFLRDNGIPMRYLPRRIRIVLKKGHPRPQPGVLFNGIISQILDQIQYNLQHEKEEENGTLSEDENEEDPFSYENEELEELNFSCNVVEVE